MSFQHNNTTNNNNNSRRRRESAGSRNPNPPSQRQEWIPKGTSSTLPLPSSSYPNPPPSKTSDSNDNGDRVSSSTAPSPTPSVVTDAGLIVDPNRSKGVSNKMKFDRISNKKNDFSNVPQLVQELKDKLIKGNVECMICYDMVRRAASMWSCSSCFSIFHLNCIKKWARAPTSVDLSATDKNHGMNWRCPGCQSVQLCSAKEIRYICFCGKRPDPPFDLYLTPHSCGELCGKPLDRVISRSSLGDCDDDDDRCPHVCVLQCHPGPCPPCKAFAPPRLCPCGKKTITTRCFDKKSVLTCGDQCNKVLECERHRCQKVCHTGPCEACRVPIDAVCFCKKESQLVFCGEMNVKGEMKASDGVFSCSSLCGGILNCGNHVCCQICHPGPCGDCELMPAKVKTCCCGKTMLQKERTSCLDPISTCPQICDKLLPCGIHHCNDLCHAGDCPPCMTIVSQSCRCGSSSRSVECSIKMNEKFVCEKACGKKKNCGRHRCSEKCCPLSTSKSQLSGDWDPHLCSMICGKKLRCGQHSCESLCHIGHCPPCLETIFTDLTCACGKTSIPPPQPCGTSPPSCQNSCLVPQPCGHSSAHSCHFGDCPPCSVPVAKECIGRHVLLRNVPCGSKDIRCNQLCGKTRICGMHTCARTCHPFPCDPSSISGTSSGSKSSCGQTCGAPRRDCRHTCTTVCHPLTLCPDARCEFPVTIACSCGRLTATVPCAAGGSSGGFCVDSIFEASIVQKLPVPLQPAEENGKKVPLGQRKLVCDEECAKMERKRVLADAFDISTPNLDVLHFGENSTVSDLLVDLFRRDPKWVLSIEERFKYLVTGKNKAGTTNGLRVHVFCPMLKEKRDAVRHIAERWKLSVHAAGWEPKRFLVVHVTPKSKVPSRMLGPKGSLPMNVSHPLVFDPLVDMDPRLVVSLLDLPGESDISALVLRFGGECELVWLNDKNALAVFSDPVRAATALRRLDHGSVYHGVVALHIGGASAASSGTSAWGRGGVTKTNPWKKAVVQESQWENDSWGSENLSGGSSTHEQVWKGKEAPIASSRNRWNALDPDIVPKSLVVDLPKTGNADKHRIGIGPITASVSQVRSLNLSGQSSGGIDIAESSEVVDDWEKACE
ncbi:Nf-x1-type zinc finger protein nfxl1 [Thalictrum thalictroides]|uniref:Nf-x1-type zinc finger protein nfxl1 n=1 Tax=Thalictrum thalictroides TaxID=46969 RepID=A0A7J6WW95_THATH|nr:Nf-x1-type zinc finger protein nfxl1 [Thalictrum thalictroides]